MDEKIDLSGLKKILDNLKERTLRNKDYYKFVIGLFPLSDPEHRGSSL